MPGKQCSPEIPGRFSPRDRSTVSNTGWLMHPLLVAASKRWNGNCSWNLLRNDACTLRYPAIISIHKTFVRDPPVSWVDKDAANAPSAAAHLDPDYDGFSRSQARFHGPSRSRMPAVPVSGGRMISEFSSIVEPLP